ncbi:hypothetical protein PENSPDRAFT_731600 [Peniophora sp. CONT]|nr:hypothetical protein PENSPDRAFT_731600 [Peniophora sp. CONT]
MKLLATLTALAAAIAARAQNECYGASKSIAAYDRPFVGPLFYACKVELGNSVEAKQNPWINKHCVAAAIAASPPIFHDALTCLIDNSNAVELTPLSTWPSLDYNVYASIVGDCAWAPGGCPITQQNFIDLVYGAIAETETSGATWPKSADILIDYYLHPIFNWTAFDVSEGIPYVNFNDWLHWGPTVNHCTPTYQCT